MLGYAKALRTAMHTCMKLPCLSCSACTPSSFNPPPLHTQDQTCQRIHAKSPLTILVSRRALVQGTRPRPPLLPDFSPGLLGCPLDGGFIALLVDREGNKRSCSCFLPTYSSDPQSASFASFSHQIPHAGSHQQMDWRSCQCCRLSKSNVFF